MVRVFSEREREWVLFLFDINNDDVDELWMENGQLYCRMKATKIEHIKINVTV